jgi:hypothetical protein
MLRRIAISAVALALLIAAFGCGGGSSSGGDNVTNTQSTALTLSSLSPSSAMAGSPDLKLSVTGSNFDSGAHRVNQIVWTAAGVSAPITATFLNTTQLTAVLPAKLLASAVTANLTVEVWDVMGDVPLATSNALKFTVNQPSITISPTTATAGSPDLILTITAGTFTFSNGRHKFNQTVWYANGQRTVLNTTFVSTTQLNATVPAALLTAAGTTKITVEIWDSQGDAPDAISPSVTFTIASSSPWDY